MCEEGRQFYRVVIASFILHVQLNREYLPPQIRKMNNRFHSEAKLPWSYDYPLANHIATNKSSANREMPLFSRLYLSFGYLRKIFPPRGLKYSLLGPRSLVAGTENAVLLYIDNYCSFPSVNTSVVDIEVIHSEWLH